MSRKNASVLGASTESAYITAVERLFSAIMQRTTALTRLFNFAIQEARWEPSRRVRA